MNVDLLLQGVGEGALFNPYYHDWSLIGILLSILLGVGPALFWLLEAKAEHAEEAYISIRARLVGRFQIIVLDQARMLLREVDQRLPYELTRPDVVEGQSRFDFLSGALALHNPEQDLEGRPVLVLLSRALSEVISTQADNLVSQLERTAAAGAGDESQSPLRMVFSGAAIKQLEQLSVATRRVRRRRSYFRRGRTVAVWASLAGGLAFVMTFVGAFFNDSLGLALTHSGLIGYGIFVSTSAIAGFVSWFLGFLWLRDENQTDG